MDTCENDITFSLVVPVRDEAASLDGLCRDLTVEADKLGEPAEIIFVNDGSSDDTDAVLHRLRLDSDSVRVVDLARTFGRSAAVTAGVEVACGKAVVTFDRRCGNWRELLGKLTANWREGFEIVHAVGRHVSRASRKSCNCLGSRLLFGADTQGQCTSADMRLIDRAAAAALRTPGGAGLTVDERVAELGFRQTTISHEGAPLSEQDMPAKGKRTCGPEGGRLLCGLLALGGLLVAAAALWAAWSLVASLFDAGPADWAWLVMALIALAGVQMASVALVGSYVARATRRAEHHPLYVVREVSGFGEEQRGEQSGEPERSGYVVYT